MITVKFPYTPSTNGLPVPIDGMTLIVNRKGDADGQNMLLDMFYTFYGILNYDKLCYETFLSDVASIDNLPLDFSSGEDLLRSLPKMGKVQLGSIGVYFNYLKNCVQKRSVDNLASLISFRFKTERNPRNPFGKMTIEEGTHTALGTEFTSEFRELDSIDSVIYLDCKNGDGRTPDFDIEAEKPKGELGELLDFIEPLFGRIPSQGAIDALGQLYSRIWCRQLNPKTLVLIDNMDFGLSCIETFDFEDVLVKIHRVTGAKFVVTGHNCIDLKNGWLVKDFSEDHPFCATLSK